MYLQVNLFLKLIGLGNGCYTSFDEMERGSLEVGKKADMVILSENIYSVPSELISQVKTEKLILSGQEYKSAVRPVINAMLDGMTNGSKSY